MDGRTMSAELQFLHAEGTITPVSPGRYASFSEPKVDPDVQGARDEENAAVDLKPQVLSIRFPRSQLEVPKCLIITDEKGPGLHLAGRSMDPMYLSLVGSHSRMIQERMVEVMGPDYNDWKQHLCLVFNDTAEANVWLRHVLPSLGVQVRGASMEHPLDRIQGDNGAESVQTGSPTSLSLAWPNRAPPPLHFLHSDSPSIQLARSDPTSEQPEGIEIEEISRVVNMSVSPGGTPQNSYLNRPGLGIGSLATVGGGNVPRGSSNVQGSLRHGSAHVLQREGSPFQNEGTPFSQIESECDSQVESGMVTPAEEEGSMIRMPAGDTYNTQDGGSTASGSPLPAVREGVESPEQVRLRRRGDWIHNAALDGVTSQLYPYASAVYIKQYDIVEDGISPKQRADPSVVHRQLEVVVVKAQNLPRREHEWAQCEGFVELKFLDQFFQTQNRPTRAGECEWNQKFTVSIHDQMIVEANKGNEKGKTPLALEITLYDTDKVFRTEVIGRKKLLIPDLLKLAGQGPQTIQISDKQTLHSYRGTLTLAANLKASTSVWTPPTLEETLESSEGLNILREPTTKNAPTLRQSQSVRRESQVTNESDNDGRTQAGTFAASMRSLSREETEAHLAHHEVRDEDDEQEFEQAEVLDRYWREELEHKMDSLVVNFIVMILVVVDVINIFVFELVVKTGAEDKEPPAQMVLTIGVLSCFIVELSLRQIAQGYRFWSDYFNIFDFIVIWASVTMAAAKYIVENTDRDAQDLARAKTTTTALRVVSRVAMAFRIARVLVNLRKARKLSGNVTKKLRSAVSQNKRRYKKHGFDLDLTYITDRIMAMSAPAFGGHTAYRNDIHIVSRFLSLRHYGRFFVINLCDTHTSSDGVMGNYHPQMLFGQVQRMPFEDHGPPLLVELIHFCEKAADWLNRHHDNVLACHCKGGKGRTGVVIAAFLLWSGHRRCAMDALELFTFRRTQDYNPDDGLDQSHEPGMEHKSHGKHNQGVEGPSQIRYIHYMEAMLYSCVDPLSEVKKWLTELRIPVARMRKDKQWYLTYSVTCMRTTVFDSRNSGSCLVYKDRERPDGEVIALPVNAMVWGDTRIDFWLHPTNSAAAKRKNLFFTIFHTSFYEHKESIMFRKLKLDLFHKDKHDEKIGHNFYLEAAFAADVAEQQKMLHAMQQIFAEHGTQLTFDRGEEIITEEGRRASRLFLIKSGSMEGCVKEVPDSHGQFDHPMGRTIPEEDDFEGTNHMQVPTYTIRGEGSIVGSSQFLNHAFSPAYRARTERVTVLMLEKAMPEAEPDTPVASVVTIQGLSTEELATFYKALAMLVGMQLSRVRAEAIRISGLRGFNDRQSIFQGQDERERLMNHCIKVFGLPVNEKLVLSSKCLCLSKSDDKPKRLRLIVLNTYIILDPEIFGPTISSASDLIRTEQVHDLGIKDDMHLSTIVLRVQRDPAVVSAVGSTPLNEALECIEITFHSVRRATQVMDTVTDLWKKAMELKAREKVRPFEAPEMHELLHACSQAHEMKKWDKIDSARDPFRHSLFLIKSGIIKLRRGLDVHRILLVGDCFGEDDFAKETVSGQYVAEAWSSATVLQINRQKVGHFVENKPELSARFHHAVCLVIEQGLREAQEDTFPGTWNKKVVAHTGMHEEEHHAQASRQRKKKEGWRFLGRTSSTEGTPDHGKKKKSGHAHHPHSGSNRHHGTHQKQPSAKDALAQPLSVQVI